MRGAEYAPTYLGRLQPRPAPTYWARLLPGPGVGGPSSVSAWRWSAGPRRRRSPRPAAHTPAPPRTPSAHSGPCTQEQ